MIPMVKYPADFADLAAEIVSIVSPDCVSNTAHDLVRGERRRSTSEATLADTIQSEISEKNGPLTKQHDRHSRNLGK